MAGRDAVHRTIVVVDIERSNHPIRTNRDQVAIRKAMYQALTVAVRRDIWLRCHNEDRGDGVLVLVPPDVPKIQLVTSLLNRLEAALERHNATMERRDAARAAATQIKLRVAVHAGEVTFDEHGVVGTAITHTFRMVEAPPLKAGLASSTGVYALIVSEWFFNEVVFHHPDARPDLYRRVNCEVKETQLSAYMRVPGQSPAVNWRADAAAGDQARGRASATTAIPAQVAGYQPVAMTSKQWPRPSEQLRQPPAPATSVRPGPPDLKRSTPSPIELHGELAAGRGRAQFGVPREGSGDPAA